MQNGKIDKIWKILGSVPDPEIPVISVVELGVIRDVQLIKNEYVISVTPTYSGCPAVKTFQDDIKEQLKINNINNFKIEGGLGPLFLWNFIKIYNNLNYAFIYLFCRSS